MTTLFQIRNPRSRAFTLVELLLAMAIIAVLASLALVVIGDAQDGARESDTQSRISVLHNLLTTRLENYETVRLPFNVKDAVTDIDDLQLVRARELRRRIVMDIISSEMPRSIDDVACEPGELGQPGSSSTFPSGAFIQWVNNQDSEDPDFFIDPLELVRDLAQQGKTPVADRFRLEFAGDPGANENPMDMAGQIAAVIRTSSEYLHMILQGTETIGTNGLEVIGNRFIDDTDGDGFPEIVDSWGNPIGFQFEMYDDLGRLVIDANQPLTIPDIDPGFEGTYDGGANDYPTIQDGVPVESLKLRIYSSAGVKPNQVYFELSNGLELITN